jgi:hypothetical protein
MAAEPKNNPAKPVQQAAPQGVEAAQTGNRATVGSITSSGGQARRGAAANQAIAAIETIGHSATAIETLKPARRALFVLEASMNRSRVHASEHGRRAAIGCRAVGNPGLSRSIGKLGRNGITCRNFDWEAIHVRSTGAGSPESND